jgi:hypothetical protein
MRTASIVSRPIANLISFKLKVNTAEASMHVLLFDKQGIIAASSETSGNSAVLDLSNLKPGAYNAMDRVSGAAGTLIVN